MLLNCPECGQQVSNRAQACPHCGCPLNERPEPAEEKQTVGRTDFLIRLISFVSCTLLCLILLLGGLFLAVSSDLFGITTSLRRIAMTDAGDGSHGDTSETRIAVKYYILQVLNAVCPSPEEEKTSANLPVVPQKTSGEPEEEIKPAVKRTFEQVMPPPELPGK